jgi:hypothetical protein
MSGTVKFVAGLAVVLVVGAGALWLLEEDGGDVGGGGAVVQGSATDDDALTDLPSAAEGGKSRLTADPSTPTDLGGAAGLTATSDDPAAAAAMAVSKPRAVLEGRVIDEAGRAVAEAKVVYNGSGGVGLARRLGAEGDFPSDPETVTDSRGHFSLEVEIAEDEDEEDALPAILGGGGHGRLALAHSAFRTGMHECPRLTEGTVDMGTIVLEAGARVAGRVVDENGRPIADASVSGRNLEKQSGGLPFNIMGALGGRMSEHLGASTTGPDGRFLVTGLGPGSAEISATADGRQLGLVEDLELQPHETLDVGDVTLGAGEAISGWIVDTQGMPVPGAVVRVSSMARIVVRSLDDMPRNHMGNEFRMREESDADGWFELSGLSSGQYTLHVSADGFGRMDRENVPSGTADLRVTLHTLGGVLLTIVDESEGEPVDGASIRAKPGPEGDFGMVFSNEVLPVLEGEAALAAAGDSAGNARPEGLYYIQNVPPQGARVAITAEGFAAFEVDSSPVDSGGTTRLVAALLPESILAGLVLDPDGELVADAQVTVSAWEPPPAMDMGGGRIELRREVSRGIGGGPSGSTETWQRVRTDDEGRFEVRGVPAGTWELDAKAAGFARSEPVTAELEEGERRANLVLEVPVAGAIAGRVVERDGTPVPAVEVVIKSIEAGSGGDPSAALAAAFVGFDPSGRNTTTDGNGAFLMEGLVPGPYEVSLARRQGMSMGNAMIILGGGSQPAGDPGETQEVEVLARQEAQVELVRAPMARLSGQVLAGGRPAKAVTVSLNEAGSFLPFGGSRAETDRFGRYEFTDINPGEYELSAVAPGAARPVEVGVTLHGGEASTKDLVFSGATLAGKVVDKDSGRGVGGVTINLLPIENVGSGSSESTTSVSFAFVSAGPGGGRSGMQMDMGGGALSRVRTGADGSFQALYVQPGEYTLQAEGGGVVSTEVGPIDVPDESLLDGIVVEAPRGAILTGLVTSSDTGLPLSGTPVSLVPIDGGSREMTVAEEGRYEFEGLAEGEYNVQVMGSGFGGAPLASEVVVLAQGETRVLDLQAAPQEDGGFGGGGRRMTFDIGIGNDG